MTARRTAWFAGGLAAAALILSAGAWAWWAFGIVQRPYAAFPAAGVVVDIPSDWNARSILARLEAAGVIRDQTVGRAWLVWTGGARNLQAGEYRFDRPASLREVLERIQRGDILLHRVTIPEGLRLDEVAQAVAAAGFGSASTIEAAFRDPAPVREFDASAPDLEGYLFPDTYWFPKAHPAAAIARAMVARFVEASGGPAFRARAQAAGLTVRQAVTLASLIEEETSLAAERPRISRVFHNRLGRRMLLQCDPTVLYALHRAGRTVATLTTKDLAFASPWNTYQSAGLPPGPICSPGAASLTAAVEPAAGPELYFVAAPGGGHRFSADLSAHQRAVQEWRRYLRSSR